jgi:hypothetical protein
LLFLPSLDKKGPPFGRPSAPFRWTIVGFAHFLPAQSSSMRGVKREHASAFFMIPEKDKLEF